MTPGLLLVAAFGLDHLLGDPPSRFHPVRLMGGLVSGLEAVLYRSGTTGLATGLLLALLHPGLVVGLYLAVRLTIASLESPAAFWLGATLDLFALHGCLAFRDLFDHVRPILRALDAEDLPAARAAVQRIVGRDTSLLDAAGVARAAVESVAESLSDGAVGPMLWFALAGTAAGLGGAPGPWVPVVAVGGALLFRAVNTLDSMVGYRNPRYLHFGRASARFDDLLGLLPARLTVLCLGVAAAWLGFEARNGWRTWWRDRSRHPSPNAGQSESFVAGALGLRLGGPTVYLHGTSDKPWLGDGRTEATPHDLRQTCRLVRSAGVAALVLLTSLLHLPSLQVLFRGV